jgi:biopolymer transport protein ExbD
MAGGGGGGDGEPEFQIAPMIDVLLVLLIFFMSITTTQVMKVDKSIQLPLAPDAVKRDDQRAEAIINVSWDEASNRATYKMDDKAYAPADLVPALAAAKKLGEAKITKSANPAFRVVIRGDRMAKASAISRAMNAAAEAGISDISFSAANRD